MAQATQMTAKPRGTREYVIGAFLLLAGLLLVLPLAQGTGGLVSTFVLTSRRAGVEIAAPDLVIPTQASLYLLGAVLLLAAIWQLARGFRRLNLILGGAALVVVGAFLIWATRDKSLNLTGMLVSSVVRAAPIAFAALSGLYSERSGVVNIGIEGMMLGSAFTAAVVASVSGSLTLGVFSGILVAMLLALLHGVLSIRYRVNQIISGTMVIILMLGLTSYLQRAILNENPHLNEPGTISELAIPVLWRIPVVGPMLFNQPILIYVLFVLLALTQVVMYQTRWGLRVRAVGEHPRAADTLGINVFRTRYLSVLLSGAMAGLGGAYMSIGAVGRFNEGMTAGKGFLGLAAMIFGNWNPGGSFLGAMIFGFFDSWQEKLSILQVGVPPDLLGMAPYLATMIVLAGVVGRARMPAADGTPYEKQ